MSSNRGPKYKDDEVELLVEHVRANKRLLFGNFASTKVTDGLKKTKWQEITDSLNAISHTERTCKQVRNKWKDLQSRTKMKVAKQNRGKNQSGINKKEKDEKDVILTKVEETVAEVLGKTAVQGVSDGIDTLHADSSDEGGEKIDDEADDVMKENSCDITESVDGYDEEVVIMTDADGEFEDGITHSDSISEKSTPKEKGTPQSIGKRKKNKNRSIMSEINTKTQDEFNEGSSETSTEELISLEKQKLNIMKEQILVDKKRLSVEEKIAHHLQVIADHLISSHAPTTSLQLPSMGEAFSRQHSPPSPQLASVGQALTYMNL